MTRAKRTAVLFLVFSAAFVVGLEASARTERLRWTHPDPDGVDGYRVHYGVESRVYTWHVDVRAPAPDPDGVMVYDLDVDDAATIYVAVTAYAGDLESVPSNERVRSPSGDPGPGDPGDDPPPSPANAAIDHFVLWNAAAGTVIDSDFTSGEQFSVIEYGCTAIEVIGNAHLSSLHSPGSVQFNFDGQTPTTCSQPGLTHENDPPYAWEADFGEGQFGCAPSLTEVGRHTLTVTPYDEDDCSGVEGPSVVLSFDVVDPDNPGDTPPSPGTIGTPGRPTLVLE